MFQATFTCQPLTILRVIRSYDFTIRREEKAPDGYRVAALTINGQFPAPLIEANW